MAGGSPCGSPRLCPSGGWTTVTRPPTRRGRAHVRAGAGTCGAVGERSAARTGRSGPCRRRRPPRRRRRWRLTPARATRRRVLDARAGHVFDTTEMQDPFRADFMALWGLPAGASAWWTQFGSDHASAESGAGSYRLCALYGPGWTRRDDDSPELCSGDRDSASRTPRVGSSCRSALRRTCQLRPARPYTRLAWWLTRTARWPNARHRPAAARQAGAMREGWGRQSFRAVAHGGCETGAHRRGAAPTRPPDDHEAGRPTFGVRPSLAARVTPPNRVAADRLRRR